jgi:protein phosphatase
LIQEMLIGSFDMYRYKVYPLFYEEANIYMVNRGSEEDSINIDYSFITHPGKYSENQDCVLARGNLVQKSHEIYHGTHHLGDRSAVFAVADGVTLSERPAAASRNILSALKEMGDDWGASDQEFTHVLHELCQKRLAKLKHKLDNGATTFAALKVGGSGLSFAYCGDSPIHSVKDGSVCRLSNNHTLAMNLLRTGEIDHDEYEQIKETFLGASLDGIVVFNGLSDAPLVELMHQPLSKGTRYVICSDGVDEHLTQDEISNTLALDCSPSQLIRQLMSICLERGGNDNISIIVLDIS